MPPRAKKSTAVALAEVEENLPTIPVVAGANGNGIGLTKRQDSLGEGNVTNMAELRSLFGTRERTWDEIEPSFTVVKKAEFENQPMVIGGFRFNQSKKFGQVNAEGVLVPTEFVSMLCAKLDGDDIGEWVVVNDGSTGIRLQLERYASRYDDNPALCPPITTRRGLRKSEYPYEEVNEETGELTGKVSTATTWYIS